jgi:hypothetical protein
MVAATLVMLYSAPSLCFFLIQNDMDLDACSRKQMCHTVSYTSPTHKCITIALPLEVLSIVRGWHAYNFPMQTIKCFIRC